MQEPEAIWQSEIRLACERTAPLPSPHANDHHPAPHADNHHPTEELSPLALLSGEARGEIESQARYIEELERMLGGDRPKKGVGPSEAFDLRRENRMLKAKYLCRASNAGLYLSLRLNLFVSNDRHSSPFKGIRDAAAALGGTRTRVVLAFQHDHPTLSFLRCLDEMLSPKSDVRSLNSRLQAAGEPKTSTPSGGTSLACCVSANVRCGSDCSRRSSGPREPSNRSGRALGCGIH